MNIMFTWLGDLCEDASDKLEDIEGLSVGMVEQAQRGFVVLEHRAGWYECFRL